MQKFYSVLRPFSVPFKTSLASYHPLIGPLIKAGDVYVRPQSDSMTWNKLLYVIKYCVILKKTHLGKPINYFDMRENEIEMR